jgi:RES domain-containing protein
VLVVHSLLDRDLINYQPISFAKKHLFRAINAQYQNNPLGWDGSLYGFGRFHRRGQPTLYFAEDVETIVQEIPTFNFANYQYLQMPVKIELTKIFDTSHDQHQKFLGGFLKQMRQE